MNKKFIQMLIAIVIFMGTSASSDEKRGNTATGGRCPEREELHKWGQKFHVCSHSDIRNDWCPPPDPYFRPFSLSIHGAVVGGINDSTLVSGSTSLGRNGWRLHEKTGDSWTYYQLKNSTGLDGPTPTCTYTVCSSAKPCHKGTCIDKPCEKDWIVGEITLLTELTRSCGGENYDIKTQGCCNGAVYDLKTQACCNGGVYDPKTQGCCNGNLCYSPYVCAENKCCPEGSSSTLCGGECCSEASICVNGQCQSCSEETKACPCPPDKKNCTPSCIPMFETCNHGVPTCPKGNILCGDVCMNPLDRYCKNGKVHSCPENNIIVNNACKACKPGEFSVNNICSPCPEGEVWVGKKCHPCINKLECKYKWIFDSNGICFSAVYATLSDGTVVNVSKKHNESISQKCCYDLVNAVQGFTSPFVCPGYGPKEWTQNSNYKCVPGSCSSSTPTGACETKCFDSCKHAPSFIQVAACYWLCFAGCKL